MSSFTLTFILSFFLTLIWNICVGFIAFVVFSGLLLLLGYISDMVDYIVMKWEEKRTEEERQRHDCTYCFYYKNGKCLTRYEKDCKSNDYFIWYPKENS